VGWLMQGALKKRILAALKSGTCLIISNSIAKIRKLGQLAVCCVLFLKQRQLF